MKNEEQEVNKKWRVKVHTSRRREEPRLRTLITYKPTKEAARHETVKLFFRRGYTHLEACIMSVEAAQ